ncbi:hypothetical protein SXIM_44860 [Streptomyces xiamenensis]|uniref:Uncharacterized protein n=1 Tax=Streptomyces xiamenensis TaxID=408015 RepID=A0A0F7FYN6_9ACTN|nr:hypothetical protein SXIM_44860 [Streptomyces xiamenensis]
MEELRTKREEFNDLLTRAQGVGAGAHAVWGGVSGRAFGSLQDKSAEHIREICDSLEAMAALLDNSLKGLSDGELEQLNQLRRAESNLDDVTPTVIKI